MPPRLATQPQYGMTEDAIARPIQFTDGPYVGRTIMTTIAEVQKADVGRKYSERDSRPVDPPPVVQVRMFEILECESHTERTVELEDSDIFLPGLICYAELFPYNADFDHNPIICQDGQPSPTPIQPKDAPPDAGRPLARANTYPRDNLPARPLVPLTRDAALGLKLHGERHQNVIAAPEIGGTGKKALYFVFSELQVRSTGHFMLKYTVMHVDHTLAHHKKAPFLAECWGGVFAVYPPKLFPGLKQSTDLTQHLSRCGVKVHTRQQERTGRGSLRRLDGIRDPPPTPEITWPSKRFHSETNGEKNGAVATNCKPTKKLLCAASKSKEDDAYGTGDDQRRVAWSSNSHVPPHRWNGTVEGARLQTIDDRAAGLLLPGMGGHTNNQTSEAGTVNHNA